MASESTICHFEIPSTDLPATRAFYRKLFGWTIEPAPHIGEEYLFIRTSAEQGAVGGGILKRLDAQHGLTLYFTVPDVEAAARQVVELGGTIVVPRTALPRTGWSVTARDPQGNMVGLFQADPSAV